MTIVFDQQLLNTQRNTLAMLTGYEVTVTDIDGDTMSGRMLRPRGLRLRLSGGRWVNLADVVEVRVA